MSKVPDTIEILGAVGRSLGLQEVHELSPTALIRVLRRNKFPLLSLVMALGSNVQLDSSRDVREQLQAALVALAGRVGHVRLLAPLWSEEFTAALSEDIALYCEAHDEYVRAAQAWSLAGIPYICLKSAGIAPSFPYTSDNVDVLVPPDRVAAARRILLAQGYVELRNCEEPLKWLFRRFVAGRSVSAIHLHAQVGWGQGYMLAEDLWARAVRSPDDAWTWVPGREDAALINVAHAWVENKEIGLHDLVKIRHALSSGDVDWEYLQHVATQRGWRDALHVALLLVAHLEEQLYGHSAVPPDRRAQYAHALRANLWLNAYWNGLRREPPTLPFPVSFVVSKVLHFQKVWRDQGLSLADKPAQTVLELARGAQQKSGLRPQQAMLIALSGVDGSGKSVQARRLAQAFDIAAIRCRVVWTRVGATPLLHALHRLRRRRGRGRPSRDRAVCVRGAASATAERGFGRHGWRLTLWAAVASADYALWLLCVRWRLLRGEVVIADRFLCDVEVELGIRLHAQPDVVGILLTPLRRLAPRPRCAYLLRLDPDLAARRAQPNGLEQTDDIDPAEQCARYDSLCRRYGLRVVDAAQPLEEVCGTIVHDSLTTYMARFNPLANALFFSNRWQLNPGAQWID